MDREHEIDTSGRPTQRGSDRIRFSRRSLLMAGATAAVAALSPAARAQLFGAAGYDPSKFRRISTQFIAALADPGATSGNNAEQWGLWRRDPGPRGVSLARYELLKAAGGVAPAQWKFDNADWWLEEHGLIMEQPEFPLPEGTYLVTGDRAVTTALTVHPLQDGAQRWELDGASVYDVTHLRCRSARYTPAAGSGSCSPANADLSAFPVTPGAAMPPVEGCNKQDYAVFFVIGVAT